MEVCTQVLTYDTLYHGVLQPSSGSVLKEIVRSLLWSCNIKALLPENNGGDLCPETRNLRLSLTSLNHEEQAGSLVSSESQCSLKDLQSLSA